MNCYCGHPKRTHIYENTEFIDGCCHCICIKYIESQEPKALEEKCPNFGKFNCICSQCYREAKPQDEPTE